MLKSVGHAFVDTGVAVLENMMEKVAEEFSEEDLAKCAKELRSIYEREMMKGYLTIHFPNSGWCNPTIGKDKKELYIKQVLHSFNAKSLSPVRHCAFCDNEAVFLADRRHVPMLTGETTINNAPNGQEPGLPICGFCLYAVQFYPLGTLKVEGKPLFWWTTEPRWTRQLIGNTYYKVRQLMELTADKFPNFSWPKTRLLQSVEETFDSAGEVPEIDVLGYHVTNYGSSPDYAVYTLPKLVLEFLRAINISGLEVRTAHRYVVNTNWEVVKKVKADPTAEKILVNSGRNFYYEALVDLGKDSGFSGKTIIRRFFLHRQMEAQEFNNYELCRIFLEKVMGMENERLILIKELADKLMDSLVLGNQESKWLKELYRERLKSGEFLRYLVRAQKRLSDLGLAFAYENILRILDLDSEDDSFSKDLWLVQDLLLIRMLEVASQRAKHVIAELAETEENKQEVV